MFLLIIVFTMAVNYNKMTMAQLKAELSKRNLQISGKKSELVARLDENDKLVKGMITIYFHV